MFPLDNLDWLKDVEELCIILKDKLYGIFVDSFVVRSYSEGNSELSDFFLVKMPTFLLFFLWRKMFWSYFWWKIIFPTINNMYNFFKKKHFSILGKINDLGHFEQIVAQKDFFLVPRDLVWLHFHTFFKKHISEIFVSRHCAEYKSRTTQYRETALLIRLLGGHITIQCFLSYGYSYFH